MGGGIIIVGKEDGEDEIDLRDFSPYINYSDHPELIKNNYTNTRVETHKAQMKEHSHRIYVVKKKEDEGEMVW